MDFLIKIMGTASAMPVVGKNQSAHVLQIQGRSFLIDCGEGTQQQLIRYGVSIYNLEAIFLTHVHGDHIFGIFGLLSTIGMAGRKAPLHIYAPGNFGPVLKFFMSYYGEGINFDVEFHPVNTKSPEVIYENKILTVSAFPLNHKIATFGYLFREKRPALNIEKEALDRYGFTKVEIGRLKAGGDIVRLAGEDTEATFLNGYEKRSGTDRDLIIKCSDVTYLPFEPRSYAYCSDTAPFPELKDWVSRVDVLYHETTYLKEDEANARLRYHSTTKDAAECARDAGVGRLIIGHYSARCKDREMYRNEAAEIFGQTYAAKEGDVIEIPVKK